MAKFLSVTTDSGKQSRMAYTNLTGRVGYGKNGVIVSAMLLQ